MEKNRKKQLPLGDISFIMGASMVLNGKAHAALGAFLQPFGEFLELDLVDEASTDGGDQLLHFYNVTRLIPCIDFDRSETDGKAWPDCHNRGGVVQRRQSSSAPKRSARGR